MKILFASSEAHPLIKTGGLADVSASLPDALCGLGTDIRLVLPAYLDAVARIDSRLEPLGEVTVSGHPTPIRLLGGTLPGTRVPLILIDSPPHFARAGDPYCATDGRDWQDNHLRFALFNRVVTSLALDEAGLGWRPDVVHCNDWQTGLTPALLALEGRRPATVFTIHNLAYQGLFPAQAREEIMLPPELWSYRGVEFHSRLSFIKGGLTFADRVTTVSPTYAREIRTHQFGYGLEGLLNHRGSDLSGILNGIDHDVWDPSRDPLIPATYSAGSIAGKALCKEALQEHFDLTPDPAIPLVAHIGRMVGQKGVDLMLDALPDLLARGKIQFIILGSGERQLEWEVRRLAESHPDRTGAHIGYDEGLAHLIEAGADIFLMPSRFEPCGLNQMYSLRYGTVPVAHRTGGLADTIVHADARHLARGTATGILFDTPTSAALHKGLEYALDLYSDPEVWRAIMHCGMTSDFSWDRSAREYLKLYRAAVKANR